MNKKVGTAIVVGAGISGIRSALDLAEVGYGVTLIDKSPHLGGILTQLDYQFPTDRCGMCKMLPLVNRDASSQYCLRKGLFHENMDVLLSTELASVEGSPGNYQIKLKQTTSWVDPDLCIGCGDCETKCPEEISDIFNLGLSSRKAIYLPVPHNIPNTYMIDPDACTKCGDCVDACPSKAITIPEQDLAPSEIEMTAGAIVLSGGTSYYNPATGKDTYGYAQLPDVVTSREFERLISGTGPSCGQLLKPSDGKAVKKIAWFQCVGSRDTQDNAEFCSSVCCMHAIKEARLTKEKYGNDVETTIFYMDMRAFGKSFHRYREEADNDYNIRFERSRIHSVTPSTGGDGLEVIQVKTNGERLVENFDMIVLSVGQRPADGTKDLAERLEIPVNAWGFCQPIPLHPSQTEREGIVISGSYGGLQDISESIIQAGSASLNASMVIHQTGGSELLEMEAVDEYRNVVGELPNILVAICICGDTLKETPDKDQITNALMDDPTVSRVVFIDQTCTAEGWDKLTELLTSENPNRILIGACMPHVYDRKLKELGRKIKLNPSLVEVVDIRTSSLSNPINSLKAGITKLKRIDPEIPALMPIKQSALVIGGGIAGMTAGLAIADHGFEVDLVEKEKLLGGNLNWLDRTLDGDEIEPFLKDTVARVMDHSNITVHTESKIVDTIGHVGRFMSVINNEDNPDPSVINHGIVILATGGIESETTSFEHHNSDAVVTQKELDQNIKNGSLKTENLNSVVMIQCVDSRQEPRNYCSRVCCASALKNALHLKEKNPDVSVVVLYRDLMAYGYSESYYSKARKAGVLFIPYQVDEPPEVTTFEDSVVVSSFEPVLGKKLEIEADLVVLATGIVPVIPEEIIDTAGIKIDQDGFFQEAESKWRPVDSIKEGIFACGIVHSARNIKESIASAEAAAQRALRILNNKETAAGGIVAEVRHSLCALCERCIATCPYEARSIIDNCQVEVNTLMCQGCGSCASVCPNSASIVRGYKDQQVMEEIDAAMIVI
ncbi:MAG: CoB--CoM heterodisulfide reductase iron-sulfur subunit A family protein [Deltaproteobacteria bacterium]|nr:CoB--CoM heterodisulfide reductase iron-sulfur subunit A family protein [Deltaproteobacteria bacterium]